MTENKDSMLLKLDSDFDFTTEKYWNGFWEREKVFGKEKKKDCWNRRFWRGSRCKIKNISRSSCFFVERKNGKYAKPVNEDRFNNS